MPEDPPLTPIEQSRVDTGFRFYSIKPGIYNGIETSLNAKHGYPKGGGTKAQTIRDLQPLADTQKASNGNVLLAYRASRMTDAEFDSIFNSHNPNVAELVKSDWLALFPTS